MNETMTHRRADAHRLLSEVEPKMARAGIKKFEVSDFRPTVGEWIVFARKMLGWSQKDLCVAIEESTGEPRDDAQISRWENGKERAQFDVLWAVVQLRGPLVIAIASKADDVEVRTQITVRRSA